MEADSAFEPVNAASSSHLDALVEVLRLNRSGISSHQVVLLAGLALMLGLAGDILFYRAALGVNALVWEAALLATLLIVAHRTRTRVGRLQVTFLTVSLVIAAFLAWRDAPALHFFNLT